MISRLPRCRLVRHVGKALMSRVFQRAGRSGWYLGVSVPKSLRKKLGKNEVHKKVGNTYAAKFLYLPNWGSNNIFTVPTGPFLWVVTINSAIPLSSVSGS